MRHLLNGIEVSPRNRDSIGVVSDFTGNPDVLSLNVDTLILPREANQYIKTWIQNNGLFLGIPYSVEMDGNITLDYYIDLSDSSAKPIVRQHEIEVKLKRRNGSDTFWEKARGTSFDLMIKDNPTYFDTKRLGYIVVRDDAAMMAFQLSVSIFMMTIQLVQSIKDFADRLAETTTTPLQGALKWVIQIIYWISVLAAIISLLSQLFPILFPRIKYFKGLYYSEIFNKGCQFLGYTPLPSDTIFNVQPGWFTLPVPLNEDNDSFFEGISNDLADPKNKPTCSASDTTPTFGAWLDEVLKQFNAKLFIDPVNKTVRIERRDWLDSQTSLQIDPALNIQPERDEQFTYNTEETWKRYYIAYTLDYTDAHTVDGKMFARHQAEYSTENNVPTTNADLVTIKGLNEVRINFAMGAPKGKLSFIELLAIPFFALADSVTSTFASIGIGNATNYVAQVLDRINVLKVSNEYFGITKSLYVKQAPAGGNKVSLDTQFYDTIYSATALWDEFHYINFIANNDYIIHEEARIRLRQSQFVSLQNNNYIFTNNKWCEVLRIEWIDEKSAATITYKEPLDWANGKVTLLKIN
jgi:hypothetical protein